MNKNTIDFFVQGSSPDPYHVTFTRNGTNLTALCNCRAGANGTHCKHRINILYGAIDNIVGDNEDDVVLVAEMLKGTDVELALSELEQAENRLKDAKKGVLNYKRKLAKLMLDKKVL